jgi:hypothetical protein
MSFEDELRETMRAHDHDAPTVDSLAERPWIRRRRAWLPLAAAAVVVAVAAGVVAATQSSSHTHKGDHTLQQPVGLTTADCPRHTSEGVPAQADGLDGADRLVPDRTPTGVVICAYLHDDRGVLTGARALIGGLSAAGETLSWEPRGTSDAWPCADYLAMTDGDNYLIGLTYSDATVWVAAPGNHCAGATNGSFQTPANLRAFAETAYRSGVWDPHAGQPKRREPCARTSVGRLGQDAVMVPGSPTELRICANGVDTGAGYDPGPLRAALNRLPTKASTHGYDCAEGGGEPTSNYTVRFSYADGPDVWVDVLVGCTPAVDNGSLTSADATTITALLRDLGVAR